MDKTQILKALPMDANMNAYLLMDKKKYLLDQFNIHFSQPVDAKGEPQKEVFGGKVLFVISQLPDENLIYWASSRYHKKDGEINFGNATSNTLLKITFREAYCLELHQTVTHGVETALLISAKELEVKEQIYFSNWKE